MPEQPTIQDTDAIRSKLLCAMGDDPTNAVADAIHRVIDAAIERESALQARIDAALRLCDEYGWHTNLSRAQSAVAAGDIAAEFRTVLASSPAPGDTPAEAKRCKHPNLRGPHGCTECGDHSLPRDSPERKWTPGDRVYDVDRPWQITPDTSRSPATTRTAEPPRG